MATNADNTISIREFLKDCKLPNWEVYYYLNAKGKKQPLYEKNNATIEDIDVRNKAPKRPRPTWVVEHGTKRDMTEAELDTLVPCYSVFLQHTEDVYVVDVDDKNVTSLVDFQEHTGCTLFEDCPWTKGNTKGIHIYIRIDGMPAMSQEVDVFDEFTGDLLHAKKNVWETTTKQVHNYSGCIPVFEAADILSCLSEHARDNINNAKAHANEPRAMDITLVPDTPEYKALYNAWEDLICMLIHAYNHEEVKHRYTSHEDWTKIAYAMARELGEGGRELFCEYSVDCSPNKEDEANEKYDYHLGRDIPPGKRPVTIATVHQWARECCPDEYVKCFKGGRHVRRAFEEDGDVDAPVAKEEREGVTNDKEAAERVVELFPHWVNCNNELYVFNMDIGLWSCAKSDHFRVIMSLSDKLHLMCFVKTATGGTWTKSAKSYGNTAKMMGVLPEMIKTMCMDNSWKSRTNRSGLGKLLFNNGTLDCKTGVFRAKAVYGFDPNVVFMDRIESDWVTNCDQPVMVSKGVRKGSEMTFTEYKQDVRERVFVALLNEDVANFVVLNFARALAGDRMKRFMLGIADTDAGKSTLTKVITKSCGGYASTFNGNSLIYRNSSSDEAQLMRPFMLSCYKRLNFSNEMSATDGERRVFLNSTLLKMLSSGCDETTGRLHGGNETRFEIHGLYVSFANDSSDFKPLDNAITNRARCIPMHKQGTRGEIINPDIQFRMDPELDSEIETVEFQQAIVSILMDSYLAFQHAGCVEPPEPESVKVASTQWVGTVVSVIESFEAQYEVTNDPADIVTSKDLTRWLDQNGDGMTWKKFTVLLQKHCDANKYTNVKASQKKAYGRVWEGIKRRVFDEEEDSDDK